MSDQQFYHTDMSVGEILHRTRVHYGQSLSDVERALRIRASQIEAIEEDRIDKLPGRVYAIGFVRSYAEYLGLNGDRMVHLFKTQAGGRTSMPQLHFPVSASESKLPSLKLVLLSLVAAVLIISAWWSLQSRDRSIVTDIPEVPDFLKAKELNSNSVVPEEDIQAQADKKTVIHKPEGIILNMTQNSWVEIKDKQGQTIVSRVLKAGDQYFVPNRPDLVMSLGNAGGVELILDEQTLPLLGKDGEVLQDISLDIDFLKRTYLNPEGSEAE